jgi:SAM-dependent methyltransferase
MSKLTDSGSPKIGYIDDLTFDEYLKEIRNDYPNLYDLLDPARIENGAIQEYIKEMDKLSWEFEGNDVGGRGAAWSLAQKNLDNRRVGMVNLIKYFSPSYRDMPESSFQILDVLGGPGSIARCLSTFEKHHPTIFTADLSKVMISACRAEKLPYVRQSASRSLLRDDALDGVLIAYGSQLLDLKARQLAVLEAHRTLKPGRRLVLHAFEVGGGVARFFDTVVHPYSRTGHPHQHFTRPGILDIFEQADFRDVRIFEMADPIILHGQTPEEAKRSAIIHMYKSYDLVKLGDSKSDVEATLEPLIVNTLGPISISPEQNHYVAQIPRSVLVAVGTKRQ